MVASGRTRDSAAMSDWLVGVAALLSTLVGVADEDVECLWLGALDAVRVQAFVEGEPERLLDVYASERAAEADRRLLADYADRGLRLRGGALQRLECRVLRRDDDVIVLRIVDRLGQTWVIDADGRRRELPRPAAQRREVTLGTTPEGWRVVASG